MQFANSSMHQDAYFCFQETIAITRSSDGAGRVITQKSEPKKTKTKKKKEKKRTVRNKNMKEK